eukprot:9024007-Heterocapsa_arctica.AAC.1
MVWEQASGPDITTTNKNNNIVRIDAEPSPHTQLPSARERDSRASQWSGARLDLYTRSTRASCEIL